jgi:predicted secreted protein
VTGRWFGATGRRVPAIALSGALDIDGALVLDDATDDAVLRTAHEAGTPVVVRARSAAEVRVALARPEVSCVLVDDPRLLELDLPEITYGAPVSSGGLETGHR